MTAKTKMVEDLIEEIEKTITEIQDDAVEQAGNWILDNHPMFKVFDEIIEAVAKDDLCKICDGAMGFHESSCPVEQVDSAADWDWLAEYPGVE